MNPYDLNDVGRVRANRQPSPEAQAERGETPEKDHTTCVRRETYAFALREAIRQSDQIATLQQAITTLTADRDRLVAERERDRRALANQLAAWRRERQEGQDTTEPLRTLRIVVEQMLTSHRDCGAADYNECDLAPCPWCVEARAALGGAQ